VSLLQSMWMFLLSLTIILEIFSFIFLKLYPKIWYSRMLKRVYF